MSTYKGTGTGTGTGTTQAKARAEIDTRTTETHRHETKHTHTHTHTHTHETHDMLMPWMVFIVRNIRENYRHFKCPCRLGRILESSRERVREG